MSQYDYDLVVLGSGPAGQKGAICAAKLGKRAAIIERKWMGGVCVHTGTIPSKTLREAILYLTGFSQRTFYGKAYALKEQIKIQDLTFRVQAVIKTESDVIMAQLRRNGVQTIEGEASFVDAHTVEVKDAQGNNKRITSQNFLVAVGTRPASNPEMQVDGKRIFNSDQLLKLESIPKDLIVVGAGVIGLEYASMLAPLGVKITLLDGRPTILDFVDREIMDSLQFQLRQHGMTFRLGEKVVECKIDEERNRVVAKLESGKTIHGEALLYTVGRQANSDKIGLEAVGVKLGDRGKIEVDETFKTNVDGIYAAGDVIGFPALASTSMEQGRIASCNMFGVPSKMRPQFFPYGIYTIPEISMVGKSEEQLTKEKVPYEIGIARYGELAKGQMLGDDTGLLKLVFHSESRKLLGVHVIGERAAEIVHIGQVVLSFDGRIDYFRDTVFNYPTLAEAYKVAALDGLNRL